MSLWAPGPRNRGERLSSQEWLPRLKDPAYPPLYVRASNLQNGEGNLEYAIVRTILKALLLESRGNSKLAF